MASMTLRLEVMGDPLKRNAFLLLLDALKQGKFVERLAYITDAIGIHMHFHVIVAWRLETTC